VSRPARTSRRVLAPRIGDMTVSAVDRTRTAHAVPFRVRSYGRAPYERARALAESNGLRWRRRLGVRASGARDPTRPHEVTRGFQAAPAPTVQLADVKDGDPSLGAADLAGRHRSIAALAGDRAALVARRGSVSTARRPTSPSSFASDA
jgi:hypothetical protein